MLSPGELRAAYIDGGIEVDQFEQGIEAWLRAIDDDEELVW
jgi:hypothetical protein